MHACHINRCKHKHVVHTRARTHTSSKREFSSRNVSALTLCGIGGRARARVLCVIRAHQSQMHTHARTYVLVRAPCCADKSDVSMCDRGTNEIYAGSDS
jgi:hypothetical protein